MKKLSTILPVFLIFCFLALPLIAVGATEQVPPFICGLLRVIRNIIAAVGFAIAIIILIIGAIAYMTAGGNEEKATKGRKLMINAIIGIAILLIAVFIITLVASILTGAGAVLNPFGDPCGTSVQ